MPTKQRTKTDFMALTISAGEGREELANTGGHLPTRWPGRCYTYTVSVQSDATGKTIRFDYHDSIDRHDKGINQLDRENLLYAFWSFCQDAQSGEMTFDEFEGEFGYESDSISARNEAKRPHQACRTALRKFRTLWHSDNLKPEHVLHQLAFEGIE